jgi:hypothetical protein
MASKLAVVAMYLLTVMVVAATAWWALVMVIALPVLSWLMGLLYV